MADNNQELYANKYRSHQRKLILVLAIILIIFGITFIGVGLFLIIYNYDKVILTIGIIMIIAGIFDIPLSLKFIKVARQKIDSYSDQEAYKRYLKIYGLQSIEKGESKDEKEI